MIRLALAALALTAAAAAQPQLFGGNEQRASTTKLMLDPAQGYKMLGGVCIQYSQPTWKQDYEGKLDQYKGQSWRLGKNYWTTMNTMTALNIGGVQVPAGAYYLGLKLDEKGGFHLLVIDSKKADSNLWSPFMPNEWKADYTCPMNHGKSEKSAEKLTITLDGQTADALELKVHWGTHQVTAKVTMTPAVAAKTSEASVEKAKENAEAMKKAHEGIKK